MIGANASVLGCLLGFMVPGWFVKPNYVSDKTYTEEQIENYKHQMFHLLLFQAAFAVVIWLLLVFTFKDKSDYITELDKSTAQAEETSSQLTFKEQLMNLPTGAAGRNFWLATASTSLTIGLFFSYSTVIG